MILSLPGEYSFDNSTTQYIYHDYGSLHEIKTDYIYFDTLFQMHFATGIRRLTYEHDPNIPVENVKHLRNRFSGNIFDRSHYYENHMITRELIQEYDLNLTHPELFPQAWLDYYYSEFETSANTDVEVLDKELVYPNPCSNYTQIRSLGHSKPITFTLYTIDGAKVLETSTYAEKQISLDHLNMGLYMYTIKDGNKIYSGKLIVQK